MRNDDQKTSLILSACGILPVVWLALLTAPYVSGGLVEIIRGLPVAMGNPFEITMCEDSVKMDCQHFFRQIFLGYFSDIVQAFDTLRKNVCGDDYTSLHNPIVLSSVLPAYGMFHSIQILFL